MLDAYYGLLTTFDGDPTQRNQQLSAALEALEIFPVDAQLLLAMGNYLQQMDQLSLATRSFETAHRFGMVDLETWHLRELAEVAAVCLGITLQLQGRHAEARHAMEESLRQHPGSARIRRHLIDLHIAQGETDEAVRLADQLPLGAGQRKALRDAVRGACRASRSDWTAALAYLQSAYLAGCNDPICLRWLTVTLVSNGNLAEARTIIKLWLNVEPSNSEAKAYLAAVCQNEVSPAGEAEIQAHARRYRVDAGTSVLDTGPNLPVPIVQVSSLEPLPEPPERV
jgi:Flp pilus assembly protein TadD